MQRQMLAKFCGETLSVSDQVAEGNKPSSGPGP